MAEMMLAKLKATGPKGCESMLQKIARDYGAGFADALRRQLWPDRSEPE